MDEELVSLEAEHRLVADDAHADEDETKTASAENLNHESVNCRHNKLKLLVRSHAIREAASPPPDPSSKVGDGLSEGVCPLEVKTVKVLMIKK